MTSVSLIDSSRLSALLQEALNWNDDVSSLMISAQNGSILAYTFRKVVPSVKALRTRSTTVTTAYAIADQDTLVFEAQRTGALTVISSIADQILLSVTGPEPTDIDPYETTVHEAVVDDDVSGAGTDHDAGDQDAETIRLRTDLEAVNQELASIIRDDLAGMVWPQDI